MSFEWFYFDASVYFEPFDFSLLDINVQVPNGAPWQSCVEISAKTKSVLFEIDTNWAWPNCSWGFFQHFLGDRIIPSWGGENGCKLKYFGRKYGNDTPTWKRTFLEVFDNKIEILPQICFGSASTEEAPAEETETAESDTTSEDTTTPTPAAPEA